MIDLFGFEAPGSPGALIRRPVDLHVDEGVILDVVPSSAEPAPARTVHRGSGALLSAPYVGTAHPSLMPVLTAG